MAVKKVIEIEVNSNITQTDSELKNLSQTIENITEEIKTLEKGTELYSQANNRLENAKNKFVELGKSIKNTNVNFKEVEKSTQKVNDVLNEASNVTQAFGINSTLLSSSLDIVNKAQVIQNLLGKESVSTILSQSVAIKAQTLLQSAYTAVVGGTTGALKAMRIALAATGIGAIIVLIGSLIAYLATMKDSTETVTEAQDRLNESLDRSNQLLKENIKQIDYQAKNAVLRAKIAGKTEEEIFKIEQEYADKKIKELGDEYDKKYKLATKFRADSKKILEEGTKEEIKITKELQERFDKELQDAKDAFYNQRQEKQTNALTRELDIANQQRDAEKKANEDAIKNREIANEGDLKKRLDARKKELDAINEQAKIIADNIKKNQEQRLKNEIEIKKKADAILKQIEEELKPEETPQEKLKREYEERLDILKKAGESTLSLDAKYVTDKLALEKKLSDEQKANRDKQLADEKILQEQRLNTLGVSFGKISELLGKNSKAGRAFAVSQALINTYQGITAELATKTATPYEFGVKLVNIASVVGIGFKAVKDILKTPDMSTGGSGASAGGGGGGAPSSAPQFNVVGNAGINQIAQTMNKEQAPVQAYVVGNKVTTQQALDRNIVENASL